MNKLYFYFVGVLCLIFAGAIIFAAVKKNSYEKQITELQNQVALNAKTIEVGKGLYEKATLQLTDLKSAMDSKDAQVKELEAQISKGKEDLLDATSLTVSWKHAYESVATATETHIAASGPSSTPSSLPGRTRVDFTKDFGYIGVTGYTLTDPAEAWVSVKQNRPLKMVLAISQSKDKSWHTYVTSSEDNVQPDISVAAVNPYFFDAHWYEKIGITSALAAGPTSRGAGLLIGIGVTYKVSHFDFGPAFFLDVTDGLGKYFGATFAWHPFERN